MKRNSTIAVMLFVMCLIISACAAKVPNGAIWKEEKILRPTAPEGFSSVLGWAQVAMVNTEETGGKARVYVVYLRLIESDGENEKIIAEEKYDVDMPYLSSGSGGLFTREPKWFANDEHGVIKNSLIKNGNLILDAAETPDKILHWWTSRSEARSGVRYLVEAKIKIEGQVCLQLGLDYWKDNRADWNGWDANCAGTNNCEGFISDWYCDTYDYKVIRVPK